MREARDCAGTVYLGLDATVLLQVCWIHAVGLYDEVCQNLGEIY